MPRSPEMGGKVQQKPASRRTSPALILAAVVCVVLLITYLGNAAWNLMHISHYDTSRFLAAATLPFPMTQQPLPQWIELASAAVFLLLVILAAVTLRAATSGSARRDKSTPYAVAETADIFIADKTRITARPAPIASPKPVERNDTMPDA